MLYGTTTTTLLIVAFTSALRVKEELAGDELHLSVLASVRMLPWAKANINPTGQALIICTAAGMAYFVAADKKILSLARRHSFENAPEHLKNTSFQGTGHPHPAFFRP
ncbi:hypothetical protein DAI22_06g028600 [Oryza sativa Japonica Group]|nr:hypothetical protein DAI22_06g028600 [Oryza sativa Japonica Group]